MNSTLDEHILQELRALGQSNLALHNLVADTREDTRNEIAEVKNAMGRLEERVGGVIQERLRKHSDNHRELTIAIGAVKVELAERVDEIELKQEQLVTEASEKRGERKALMWGIAAAASVIGSVIGGVVTAYLIKAIGG